MKSYIYVQWHYCKASPDTVQCLTSLLNKNPSPEQCEPSLLSMGSFIIMLVFVLSHFYINSQWLHGIVLQQTRLTSFNTMRQDTDTVCGCAGR